jgi:hypothetical protein
MRCRREGTAPLVERQLRGLGSLVPAWASAVLRELRLASTARHLRAVEIMAPLLLAARAEGLLVAACKGFHLAETLYPEPGLRPYLDIDLLVAPSSWRKALDWLQQSGFRADIGPGGREPSGRVPAWTLSPVFRRDGLAVELHPNPLGLQIPSLTETGFWSALREERIGSAPVLVPPWSHELVHAAIHAQQHSYGRLSWLVDLAEMAARPDLDWPAASRLAGEEGLGASVLHSLRIVSRCWPGSIPAAAERLFRTGLLAERASRFFWPIEAAAARKQLAAAPYYMPSVFAALRRGSLLGIIRGLRPIFFPPRGWVAAQLPGRGPMARAGYAVHRLLRPWVYLASRRLRGR